MCMRRQSVWFNLCGAYSIMHVSTRYGLDMSPNTTTAFQVPTKVPLSDHAPISRTSECTLNMNRSSANTNMYGPVWTCMDTKGRSKHTLQYDTFANQPLGDLDPSSAPWLFARKIEERRLH